MIRSGGGGPRHGTRALINETPETSPTPPALQGHREGAVWGAGGGPSADTNSAGTLVLDFPGLELGEVDFCHLQATRSMAPLLRQLEQTKTQTC